MSGLFSRNRFVLFTGLLSAVSLCGSLYGQESSAPEQRSGKSVQVEREIHVAMTSYLEKKAASLAKGLTGSRSKISVHPPTASSSERLSPCTDALEIEDNKPRDAGRQRLKVSCNGFRRWSIYVTGDIVLEAPVLTARYALQKGDVLNAGNVVSRLDDISRLRSGYVTDIQLLQGQTLRRSISAGTVLNSGLVERTSAIRKGDRIAIVSGTGGFNITVSGTAMEDGAVGENIRVKNSSSGKTLTGTVYGADKVVVP